MNGRGTVIWAFTTPASIAKARKEREKKLAIFMLFQEALWMTLDLCVVLLGK